jgi:hypothetical protein
MMFSQKSHTPSQRANLPSSTQFTTVETYQNTANTKAAEILSFLSFLVHSAMVASMLFKAVVLVAVLLFRSLHVACEHDGKLHSTKNNIEYVNVILSSGENLKFKGAGIDSQNSPIIEKNVSLEEMINSRNAAIDELKESISELQARIQAFVSFMSVITVVYFLSEAFAVIDSTGSKFRSFKLKAEIILVIVSWMAAQMFLRK